MPIYIIIGVVGLLVGALIAYLVVSNGNNSKVQQANRALDLSLIHI